MKDIQWLALGVNRLTSERWDTWRTPLDRQLDLYRARLLLSEDDFGVLQEIGGASLFLRCFCPLLDGYGVSIKLPVVREIQLFSAPLPPSVLRYPGAIYFQGCWRLNCHRVHVELDFKVLIEEGFSHDRN